MENRITRNSPVIGITAKASGEKGYSEKAPAVSIDPTPNTTFADEFFGEQEKGVQQLEKAIRAVQGPEKSFEISVHEETHTIMVKVFNKQTGDLIREIPQEKLLDMVANMMELNGLIVDKRI